MKIRTMAFLLALATVQSICAAEPDLYSVRFGSIETDANTGKTALTETVSIPLKLKDTGFRYGFEITPPDNKPFSYQYTLHFPSPPEILTGDLGAINPEHPSVTAMSEKLESQGGSTSYFMWFDPGDPTGDWNIEIFVNGQLQKTVSFTVLAK